MAALDNDSDSELELEEKQFTIGAHTFQVHVVGELPLETLFALESKRDEISGQRAWPGSLLLAAEVAARPALVEDRAVVELGAGAGLCAMVAARAARADDGGDRRRRPLPRSFEEERRGQRARRPVRCRPSKCFWGRDAPPVGDLVLAGDVLYKRALVEPFLDALEAALAPGGRALLCHLPRAGVSREVVEAALRAREAAGGPALAAVRAPASAEFGDDCTADDAAAARVYERLAADDDADARRSRFAVRVSNLANRATRARSAARCSAAAASRWCIAPARARPSFV